MSGIKPNLSTEPLAPWPAGEGNTSESQRPASGPPCAGQAGVLGCLVPRAPVTDARKAVNAGARPARDDDLVGRTGDTAGQVNQTESDERTLDLSFLTADEAQAGPGRCTIGAWQKIESVRLPAGLSSIPDWIAALPNLKRLDLPHFSGFLIKLRHPRLEQLHIAGASLLKRMDVPARAEVYCREPWETPQKIKVLYRDIATGKVVSTGSAIGRSYYTAGQDGKIDYRNLNASAFFPDGSQEIVCRHLATKWARRVQAHRARGRAGRFADAWAAEHDDPDRIARSTSPTLDALYYDLHSAGQEQYVVEHARWGAFLSDQYATLKPGAAKQFVVSSDRHVMAIELRIVQTPRGERYVTSFYDPNRTLSRVRNLEDDLHEIGRWTIAKLMSLSDLSVSFGSTSLDGAALFTALPPDVRAPLFGSRGANDPGTRKLTQYVSAASKPNRDVVHHLFASGQLDADVLRSWLAQCDTSDEREVLLSGRSGNGISGVCRSMEVGQVKTIETLGDLRNELIETGTITAAQAYTSLEPDPASSALHMGMARGSGDVIRAYGGVLIKAFKSGWLSGAQLYTLLAAKDPTGCPALNMAMRTGKAENVRAFGELLAAARAAGALSREQILQLLAARADRFVIGSTPGLCEATQVGDADTVRAFWEVLRCERQAGSLTDDALFELLEGRRGDGVPSLYRAFQQGHTNIIGAVGEMLADPDLAGKLSDRQIFQLLSAQLPDRDPVLDGALFGDTGLDVARRGQHTDAVAAFRQVVNDAHRRGQLTAEQRSDLLREA